MKKTFEHPTIEIEVISFADVILASLTEGVLVDPFAPETEGGFY